MPENQEKTIREPDLTIVLDLNAPGFDALDEALACLVECYGPAVVRMRLKVVIEAAESPEVSDFRKL